MPRHFNTRAVTRLREWAGAKGESPIDTLAPEIVPVIPVADLTGQDIAARVERYKMGYVTQGAVAANYAHCQILNPATSEWEVVVDAVRIRLNSNTSWSIRIYDTALTTQGGNLSTVDLPGESTFTWGGGAGDSAAQLRNVNHTSVYGSIILALGYTSSSVDAVVPLGIRLLAGRGIVAVAGAVNIQIHTSWAWREQQLVP